jgi:hypothetical protein
MCDHPGSSDIAVIHQQVVLALCDAEGAAWEEAIGLEGRTGEMLAVAAVAKILKDRCAHDREMNG